MANPIIGRGWHFPPMLDERGTIALTGDADEAEQSIRIILGTAPGQRVMRPEFGCRIHELVFAPNNMTTAGLAARYIGEALGRWEPRITVKEVDVQPDPAAPDCLTISLRYQVNAIHSARSLVFPFYLIPAENRENSSEERSLWDF